MLTRKTAGYIFYCQTMKNIHKKILQRSIGMMSPNKTLLSDTPANVVDTLLSSNPDLPLPGNIGIDYDSLGVSNDDEPKRNYQSLAGALLNLENEVLRKNNLLNQFVETTLEEEENLSKECFISLNQDQNDNKVECRIVTCPPTLKKGFQRLFSMISDADVNLTVVTISQETENDMAVWSMEVEDERETLFSTFIENAKEIVDRIEECGYWADFIDPSSGQAYHGEYKNETLFETDDRFNQLGFHVEDLGCCKALSHQKWGTRVFVGVLFTNAPMNSHVFASISESSGN